MKVNIKNEEDKVNIEVTFRCGYAGDYIFTFTHNTGRESTAGLVAETVYVQFTDQIAAIRKDAYEQGWKDKTQRKKKRTWFSTCFNSIKMS